RSLRRPICACAAVVLVAAFGLHGAGAPAQDLGTRQKSPARESPSRVKRPPAPPPLPVQPQKFPPRAPFTAADDAIAAIADMPDARFWADSDHDSEKALPAQRGPWLILTTGGADGAFGAGLLNGLSAAGNRPDYALITGVST